MKRKSLYQIASLIDRPFSNRDRKKRSIRWKKTKAGRRDCWQQKSGI